MNTQNEDDNKVLYKTYNDYNNLNLFLCIKTTIPTTIPTQFLILYQL